MSIGTAYIQTLLSSVWPNWKITRQLGKGSYGTVYEIVREDLGTRYASALKVLRMETVEAGTSSAALSGYDNSFSVEFDKNLDEFERSVRTEIDLMMQLKGAPNIVAIEDYAVLSDTGSRTILLRMEALESLDKYIKRTGPLQQEEVVSLGLDMCTALELCERKAILHRDIKPSNIYHSDNAGYKLGDFGISRTLASFRERMSMTGIGTIQYMAPEVYFGGKYDHTVDIYSLGIVLYIYLNDGLPPFCSAGDRDQDGLLSPIVCHEANMRRLVGDIPPYPVIADQTLAEIVCKACHPDPAHRFQSAGGLREALIMYLHERDSQTGDGQTGNERHDAPVKKSDHPPNPPDKPRPRFPIKPILFAACAAALILVIAAAKGALSFGTGKGSEVTYTVLYEDAGGNMLDQMTYEGTSGEKVKIRAPLFDGYTARTNAVSIVLSDVEEDNTVTIVYEAVDNDKTVAYTIVSEDNSGITLAKRARHGVVGQRVTEVAEQRDGYSVEEDRQNIVLSDNESSNVIYFIYSKDETGSGTPTGEQSINGKEPDGTEDPKGAETDQADGGGNSEIPSTALRYGNHIYYAVNTDTVLSFWQAKSYCESLGGYMAVINDDDENTALYNYVFDTLGYQSAYFGLTNDGTGGKWYWSDGSDYEYENWLDGQPDNLNGDEHYALFYYKDTPYKWNDGDFGLDDSGTVTFLVEWDEE